MYEQSPDFFKQFRINHKFIILNHEAHFSGFAPNANFAVSLAFKQFKLLNHSIDNNKHYAVPVEFTKKSTVY